MADSEFQIFLKKKLSYRILDLGESNNFLSIAPHFFSKKNPHKGLFGGLLGAPKTFKILVNDINKVMCIHQGIFQDQIQAD